MSRIGRKPIEIPSSVNVGLSPGRVQVNGPLGELSQQVPARMKIEQRDGEIVVTRPTERGEDRALNGLTRTLIANMVEGVTKGFEKRLEIQGVGYRAALRGTDLELSVGYSHPVVIQPREVVQGQQERAGCRGRQIARRERQEGGGRARGLRPRRLPVPRTRQGARRRRTRGRPSVLMAVDVEQSRELKERVVEINRVAKVVKGGRRFSFTALVVIGDEVDRVGVGYGKAREVPLAISKAVDDAKKNLFTVPKSGQTITHEVLGRFDAARVLLRPASEGTGVIAGGGVRAVLELAGIRNVLAKSLGTQNPINLVKATITALQELRSPQEMAELRGLSVAEVLGVDGKKEKEPEPGQEEAPANA